MRKYEYYEVCCFWLTKEQCISIPSNKFGVRTDEWASWRPSKPHHQTSAQEWKWTWVLDNICLRFIYHFKNVLLAFTEENISMKWIRFGNILLNCWVCFASVSPDLQPIASVVSEQPLKNRLVLKLHERFAHSSAVYFTCTAVRETIGKPRCCCFRSTV